MGHSGRIGRSRQHNAVPGSHKRPPPPHRHRKSLTAAPIAGRAQLDPGAATPAHRHSAVSGHPLRQPFDTSHLEHAKTLLENFAWIAAATNHVGPDGASLREEQDGFFYNVLRRPDGSSVR